MEFNFQNGFQGIFETDFNGLVAVSYSAAIMATVGDSWTTFRT